MHYYDKKYPYFKYPILHQLNNGLVCAATMYSIPVFELVGVYKKAMGVDPKSFLDCGCATGRLLEQADKIGINAKGIDINLYPESICIHELFENYKKMLKTQKIEIVSILDYQPSGIDLSYCNGTLTYITEANLDQALTNLHKTKMLIAIHNTAEDIEAALQNGDKLLDNSKPRLIKPRDWWQNRITNAGFDVNYNKRLDCFCAISR